MTDPDSGLILRAKQGDARAFHELFVRHRATVTRIVFRTLGPSPDLEDVVQEVFLNVYRSLRSFRGDAKFTTWLYRLATNVTRMHLRKGRSRPRIVDTEVPERPRMDARPQLTPDLAVEQAERVRALYRLLDRLSEKKREVLVLHDLEGNSPADISTLLEVPVLTVRTRLFYARKDLYAMLAKEPCLEAVMKSLLDHLPGKPKRSRSVKDRSA